METVFNLCWSTVPGLMVSETISKINYVFVLSPNVSGSGTLYSVRLRVVPGRLSSKVTFISLMGRGNLVKNS